MLGGQLEWAGRFGVAGWARREPVGRRDAFLMLETFADDRLIGVVRADRYRPDLAAAGEGDGTCAFELWFDPALPATAKTIAVRAPAGEHLPGSPVTLPSASHGHRHTAPASCAAPANLPDRAPIALVVDEALPDAARDAGSAALLSHLAALERLGFAVAFAPLPAARAAIHQLAGRVRLAYVHRLRPMLDLHAEIRAANPGVRLLFSVADLGSLRLARQARVEGGPVPRGLIKAEATAIQAADAVITHSTAELDRLATAMPDLAIHAVPWAVAPRPIEVPFAQRRGIAFLGNFGHAPNRDAALMLIHAVMPRIWARGALPCLIAGYGVPADLRSRAGRLVQIIDALPDAAELWRCVRVSAAPLRFGAGVKGKVLDSLAAGVPCVCSPVAAEGIGLPPALVAADPMHMADSLWRLHEDAAANAAAAKAGFAMLSDQHSAEQVVTALAAAVGGGARRRPA